MALTVAPIFRIFPKKIMLPLLGQKKIQSVVFMWVLPLLGPKKSARKRCLYLGCCLYQTKKNIEVYALIRSVAFIRVLLLFGGLPPVVFYSLPWVQPGGTLEGVYPRVNG